MRLITLLTLLSFNAFAVEVNTGNLLNNSTFGTGTTYSTDGWTVSEGTDGHNYMSSGGANGPGGAVAATNNTSITQTIDSIAAAAEMTVPEIQRGWSSTMSTDLWHWNAYDNTTTLTQTITDSEGNVTTQRRIINDDGCGYSNCGQYGNYTDTHIQGSNSSTDFSIGVNVSNSNERNGHWGPDIDDTQLTITYTDVPPIDTVVEEELNNLPDEDDWTFDENLEDFQPDFEDEFVFEDDFEWEEDFYFEEDFDMEEYMTVDFEDQWVDMEEMDFEEMDMGPEMVFEDEFIDTNMEMTSFDDMYMEEFEEFEEFEDAWGMEPEMELTEMDTFFNEMSEDEFTEFETMSEDEFEEFLEEEFPEEFAEMTEEMNEPEPEMEMTEPEPEMEVVSNEEDDMISEEMDEPEPEMDEPENETTEEADENVEEEPENEESPSEVVENEAEENEPDSEDVADAEIQAESGAEQETVQKAEVKETRKISIDDIKINKVKVNVEKITLFSDQGTLETYEAVSFYQPEQIYTDVDTSFFDQIDMVEYNKQIYQNISLASYTNNDPVEIHRKNVERIYMEKQRLLIELKQLKGQQ